MLPTVLATIVSEYALFQGDIVFERTLSEPIRYMSSTNYGKLVIDQPSTMTFFHLTNYGFIPESKSAVINRIYSHGTIMVFITSDNVVVFRDITKEKGTISRSVSEVPVCDIGSASSGNFIVTRHNLIQLVNGTGEVLSEQEMVGDARHPVYFNNLVWFALHNQVYSWDPDLHTIAPIPWVTSTEITAITAIDQLCIGTMSGEVYVVVNNGYFEIGRHSGKVNAIECMEDGVLASASDDCTVQVTYNRRLVRSLLQDSPVTSLFVLSRGRLVVGTQSGLLRIYT